MLPLDTITTWEEFLRLFLEQNLPMKIVLASYEVLFDFKQESTKMLGQVWERFMRIMRVLIGNGVESVVNYNISMSG